MTGRQQASLATALSLTPPLTLFGEPGVKLELKPYLQPFERELAKLELVALVGQENLLDGEDGFWRVRASVPESLLRERLTYWQRVGTEVLSPTRQTLLELSQNGLQQLNDQGTRLHRARRLRYGVHGLHEYRGKFFPQLVRSLLNVAKLPPGGVVLDPMCGSGTALCETVALSGVAIGIDLNPLSVLISRTKSGIVAANRRDFADDVRTFLEGADLSPGSPEETWPADIDYLRRWFAVEALEDVAGIIRAVSAADALLRDFFLVCLSNVLRPISWQKDADLRVRKEVGTYRRGQAVDAFRDAVADQLQRIDAYLKFLPEDVLGTADVYEGDSTSLAELVPEYRGKVDVIVTSPPYATALPYLDTDRLSLAVLGLLERRKHSARETLMIGTREITERARRDEWSRFDQRRHELPDSVVQLIDRLAADYHGDDVGFRRRNLPALLAKYYLAMSEAMASARQVMRPGGSAFYVVGNNSTTVRGEKVEIPTDRFLWEIAERLGWKQVEMINMELLPSRDIFRDNRGSKETLLWLQA